MTDKYEKMLRKIPLDEPCSEMYGRVVARIEQCELRRCRLRSTGYGLLALASLVAFFPVIWILEGSPFWGVISGLALIILFSASLYRAVANRKEVRS